MQINKLNHIFFYKDLKNIVFLFILLFFFYVLCNYQYDKIIFVIFSIVVLGFLYISLNIGKLFFFNFLSIFIFLGFWFKFTFNYISDFKYLAHTGDFEFVNNQISLALETSIYGLLGLFLPFFFHRFLDQKISLRKNKLKGIRSFYNKNKVLLLLFLLIFILILNFTNYHFSIFQKGQVYQGPLDSAVINFYKVSLLFGISLIFSFVIFFEIKKNKYLGIVFGFLESYLSSISLMSRALMFTHYSYLVGYFSLLKKMRQKLNYKIILICFFSIFLIILSNISVKNQRIERYNQHSSEKISDIFLNQKSKSIGQSGYIVEILANRFVGIDGVMAVISNEKERNFSRFKSTFHEGEKGKNNSYFYEFFLKRNQKFTKKKKLTNEKIYKNSNLEAQFSPGIIAYLSILNSNFVLLSICFLISITIMLVEIILLKLFDNTIFVSIIIFQFVYRLVHFGYNVSNTYQIFLALFLIVALTIAFDRFLKKIKYE